MVVPVQGRQADKTYVEFANGVQRGSYTFVSFDSWIFSISNPGYRSLLGRFKVGGPFTLLKYEAWTGSAAFSGRDYVGQPTEGTYVSPAVGGLRGRWTAADAAKAAADASNEAYSEGASAVARANPTKPLLDLGVSVGELAREGIPRGSHTLGVALWREQTALARAAGKDYLSYEFGWKPLIRDIKAFAQAVQDVDSSIAGFTRRSSKRQRRSFRIGASTESGTSIGTLGFAPRPINTLVWNLAPYSWTQTTSTEKRFTGAFRYYVPEGDIQRYAAYAKYLTGGLTPETLWNLAPWTWAMDWFGNVGDVVSNISHLAMDATVMEWGYSTVRSVTERHVWGPPVTTRRKVVPATKCPNHANERATVIVRVSANPYGFSAKPVVLTPRQLAILASIGITR